MISRYYQHVGEKSNLRYDIFMISRIKGDLLDLDLKHAVVDVSGVGYKVYIGGETVEYLSGNVGKEVTLHTYLAVRENILDLYGFKDSASLSMFELLITVSGVGPKSALSILNVASPKIIEEAVIEEDTSYLTKVSGLGKKVSEKIVLELKGKFKGGPEDPSGKKDVTKEALAIDALKTLGFDERQARDIVKKMPKDMTTEEIIRKALREIGNPN
jgi:holliday junction DNA helicase RuvA